MTFVGRFFGWLREVWSEFPPRFRAWVLLASSAVGAGVVSLVMDYIAQKPTNLDVASRVAMAAFLTGLGIVPPTMIRKGDEERRSNGTGKPTGGP